MFFQSVTQAGGTVFLSVEATDNHTFSYHTKYAKQVTFLINFTGQVELFLSHKGKSWSQEATRKCYRAQLCWTILYLPISSYMLTP